MKPAKLMRSVIVMAITAMLILGSVPWAYAAGNYHVDVDGGPGSDSDPTSFLNPASLDINEAGDNTDDIVWSKAGTGPWHIWRMNDGGTNRYQLENAGTINEHPVYDDTKTRVVWTRDMRIWVMDRTDPTPNQNLNPPALPLINVTNDEFQLTNGSTPDPGGTVGGDNHPYTHTPTTPIPGFPGSQWIYFNRRIGGTNQIRRMRLDFPVPTPEGLGNSVVQVPGLPESPAGIDRWHPTVATLSDGNDYLVWVEAPDLIANSNGRIRIYDITNQVGPVTLVDAGFPGDPTPNDPTVLPTEEIFAPNIIPQIPGDGILYDQGDPTGGLLLWVEKRGLNGTPLIPGDDPGPFYVPNDTPGAGQALVLTPERNPANIDATPYADYSLPANSDEMDFVRVNVGVGDIFWKNGLAGLAPVPINITNDPVNGDTIVVEPSGCNPKPVQHVPVPIKPVPINPIATGFALMIAGSMMLFWQRRRRSQILV